MERRKCRLCKTPSCPSQFHQFIIYFFAARGDRRVGVTYLFSFVECVDEFDEICFADGRSTAMGLGRFFVLPIGRPRLRFSGGDNVITSGAFSGDFMSATSATSPSGDATAFGFRPTFLFCTVIAFVSNFDACLFLLAASCFF